MVVNRPLYRVSDSCMSQKLSDLHRKPRFRNSQNYFPFSPFSDNCLSKIRVKTWGEESYIEELHAIPAKFRNKLFSFHY